MVFGRGPLGLRSATEAGPWTDRESLVRQNTNDSLMEFFRVSISAMDIPVLHVVLRPVTV